MCEECSHNIMESFLVFLYFNALMDFVLNVVKTLCSVWFDLKAYKILTLDELVYLVFLRIQDPYSEEVVACNKIYTYNSIPSNSFLVSQA
jgi:hypothetical protein